MRPLWLDPRLIPAGSIDSEVSKDCLLPFLKPDNYAEIWEAACEEGCSPTNFAAEPRVRPTGANCCLVAITGTPSPVRKKYRLPR
jgi:hypothetical protein